MTRSLRVIIVPIGHDLPLRNCHLTGQYIRIFVGGVTTIDTVWVLSEASAVVIELVGVLVARTCR